MIHRLQYWILTTYHIRTRWYLWGIQRLFSAHQVPVQKSRSFHFRGEGGILGNLRPELSKSFMRSSNPPFFQSGEGGILGLPRIAYSWDFEHKIFSTKLGPASQHTMCVETNDRTELPQVVFTFPSGNKHYILHLIQRTTLHLCTASFA